MSAKSKRQSQAAAAAAAASLSQSQMSTPQAGTSSQAARVVSPISPTRKTRIQEKNELAGLNNRFAAVIERNQHLELENAGLITKVKTFEEQHEKLVKKKVESYQLELDRERQTVNETAKERMRLDLENQQLKKDFADTKQKLTKKTEETEKLQNLLNQLDVKYNDAVTKNNASEAKVASLAKEVKELKDDINKSKREIDHLRQQLEQESVARVSAENQLKARNEDLLMKNRLLEEEITEVKSRHSVDIQEVNERAREDYDLKLQDRIQELREDYEQRLQEMQLDRESLESQKNSDQASQLERYKTSYDTANKELQLTIAKNAELNRQLRVLESEKAALLDKIAKLERDSSEDRAHFARILSEKDGDINRITDEKTALIKEYEDLMDVKLKLNNEISTYRKLLETEEKRLSMKSPATATVREMTPTARATPLRGKRKLGGLFQSESQENAFEYVSDAVSHGDIEIATDDPEGHFIRLRNKSDKDISLNGYQLIRLSGDLDTTHKFGRGAKILANATATVWSADAPGAKHAPPHDYALKEQMWSVSDHYKTVLIDNTSTEQAVRETKKEQIRHHKRRIGYDDAEELFHQEGGERAGPEKCVIM